MSSNVSPLSITLWSCWNIQSLFKRNVKFAVADDDAGPTRSDGAYPKLVGEEPGARVGNSGEQRDYQSSGRRWAVVSLCTQSQFYEKCDKAPLIRLFCQHRILLNYFKSSGIYCNVFYIKFKQNFNGENVFWCSFVSISTNRPNVSPVYSVHNVHSTRHVFTCSN